MRRLILSSIIVVLSMAFATNYYVDTNHPAANDNNPGTPDLPFKTIQKGIDVAYAGDTVFVKEGLYQPGTNGLRMRRSGAAGNKIVFTTYQTDSVTIQFPSSNQPERGWWWNGFRDYLIVNGFEIIGAKYAILVQGDHNDVTNCVVHNTGSDGLCIWGGSYNLVAYNETYATGWNGIYIESRVDVGSQGRANYNIVEYNYSHDNPQHFGINIYPETSGIQDTLIGNIVRFNISKNNKGGMYIRRWMDGEIYGNLFVDNTNNGLFLHHYTNDPPYPFPSNLKIYNNTFVNNTPYWTICNESFIDIEIKNNIFVQNYSNALIKMSHTSGCELDYNLYYNPQSSYIVRWSGSDKTLGGMQAIGQELNGIDTDPMLLSDYHLPPNSPARDAGVNLGAPYNYDMDGTLRGGDGYWDIGTYEYYDPSGIKEEHQKIKNQSIQSTIVAGQLHLPVNRNVRLFDLTGRIVRNNNIAPGIYFMEVDGQIQQKIVKIK